MKRLLAIVILLSSFQLVQAQDTPIQKKIRQMLELSGSAELGIQVATQMASSFQKAYPDVPEKFWDDFLAEIDADELIDLVIPIYEKYYTEEDVDGLIEFYKSSLGRKMVRMNPKISSDSMEAGRAWGEKIGRRVAEKMRKEGYFD